MRTLLHPRERRGCPRASTLRSNDDCGRSSPARRDLVRDHAFSALALMYYSTSILLSITSLFRNRGGCSRASLSSYPCSYLVRFTPPHLLHSFLCMVVFRHPLFIVHCSLFSVALCCAVDIERFHILSFHFISLLFLVHYRHPVYCHRATTPPS